MKKNIFLSFMIFLFLGTTPIAFASDKNWSGSGDQVDWADDQNWAPWGVPTAVDDVAINVTDASVDLKQSFNIHSLTLGANRNSTLTVDNFISGTVAPASTTDVAILNSHGGTLVLKGDAGKVTLKGKYKEADTALAEQPSLLFYAQ